MSREKYEDDCPLCRPIIIDAVSRTILPDDSPEMVAVLKLWDETTLEQRQAWHRITCNHSTDPTDQDLVRPFLQQMSLAVKNIKPRQT